MFLCTVKVRTVAVVDERVHYFHMFCDLEVVYNVGESGAHSVTFSKIGSGMHTLSTAGVSHFPGIFPTARALNAPLVFWLHLKWF